jgi:hypothetical protein
MRREIAVNDLYTWAGLGTIAGASAATLLTANVAGTLLGARADKARKWIALGVALLLSYLTAAFATAGSEKWIIAFFNGLVIFSAALGINQLPPSNRAPSPARIADNGNTRVAQSWA